MKKINILGEQWTIEYKCKAEDKYLNDCDGYCDKTTRTIVIDDEEEGSELGRFDLYQKKVLRHELIHAFLFESGLGENHQHANEFGHDETMIDWVAIQFPKLIKAFDECECL